MTKNNLKPSKYLHHIISHITAKLIVSLVPKALCNYMTIAHVKYIDSCKISSLNFQCFIHNRTGSMRYQLRNILHVLINS